MNDLNNTWKIVAEAVSKSFLSNRAQKNVLNKLDETLGTYMLSYKFPVIRGTLSEDEFAIYSDVLCAMNEAKLFPKISTDAQYKSVVQDIFDACDNKPSRILENQIINMDAAYQNNDWKLVNTILKKIETLLSGV
jgi:hypothetical protein